jgi:hypothetical protein
MSGYVFLIIVKKESVEWVYNVEKLRGKITSQTLVTMSEKYKKVCDILQKTFEIEPLASSAEV